VKIVRSGSWRYDAAVDQSVDVVALDFDFWYEVGRADDALEPAEEPTPLGEGGALYYVRFGNAGRTDEPTWVDSAGYSNVADAVAFAQSRVPSPIRWD